MKKLIINLITLSENIASKFRFLLDCGYCINEINLRGLSVSTQEARGGLGPYVEVIYSNNKNRLIYIHLHQKKFSFVHIKDPVSKKEFSYNHFIVLKKWNRLDHEYYEKKKSEQNLGEYFDYYASHVKTSFEGELKEVILGNTWIDVPFDWQGMK